jgi:UDP-N-acetyl-D-mannosaminuronate dehydrogenase
MQKYKKVAMNIAFLTMILSAGITNNYFSWLDQDSDLDLNFNNKKIAKYSQEKQEKILNTFENNDYETWKKIINQNNKINNIIDESVFRDFINARIAARNGRYDEAIIITENLKQKIKISKPA